MAEKGNLFQGFAADYDRMINWQERLARETPFFKKVFAEKTLKENGHTG